MSIPSSRLDVATSAGQPARLEVLLDLRAAARGRCEPWWARTSSSPASSLSRWASRSARRRLLVKTIVLRWPRISSRMRGWIAGQMLERMSPDRRPGRRAARSSGRTSPSAAMSSTGTMTCELERLARAGVDDRDLAARPDAAEEAGDRLERPLGGRQPDPLQRRRIRPVAQALRAARGVRARCAPRFEPAIAWTSSMITCSTPRSDLARRAGQQQVERSRGS